MFDYVFQWSNAQIWPDSVLPGPEDFVVIPDTMGVVLDDTSGMDSGALNILMIQGLSLHFRQLIIHFRLLVSTRGGDIYFGVVRFWLYVC